MRVRDIMNMSVQTCVPQDSLDSVARKLWDHDCGCIPVLDGEGRPGAMITDRDICMAAYTRGKPLAALRVADSMSKSIATCRPEDELEAAAGKMAKALVRRLPVVDGNGKLVGILSLNDLARAAAEEPAARGVDSPAAQALRVLVAVCRSRVAVPAAARSAAAPAPSQPAAAKTPVAGAKPAGMAAGS
jgi:CBS domain-containing protein